MPGRRGPAGLRPIKVTITAGNEVTRIDQRHFHLAKSVLISNLDAALHTGTLKFAPQLLEAGAMKHELAHFDRHVGAAGRATCAARAGTHDDLVLEPRAHLNLTISPLTISPMIEERLYIVTYDIADDKRGRRVFRLMHDY